jgi:hypothetical protein
MWKDSLWISVGAIFFDISCGKVLKSAHPACEEKTVGAVRKNGVFHISFSYCFYCYILFFLFI